MTCAVEDTHPIARLQAHHTRRVPGLVCRERYDLARAVSVGSVEAHEQILIATGDRPTWPLIPVP